MLLYPCGIAALKLAKPLTQQWLLRLLTAACLYCVLILGVHYYQGKQLQQARLAALPRHVQQQFMPLLAQSVWDVDPATIQNLLQGILDMDGVAQVTLLNVRGQPQVQLGSGQLVSHQIELPIQAHGTGGQGLGTLRLSLSLRQLEYHLWQSMVQTLLELAVALVLMFWLSRRFMHKHILQPLQQLGQANAHQPATPWPAASDEIAQLGKVLASQAEARQQQLLRLQQDKYEQSQQREHLTSLLAMRTAELEQLSRFHQMVSEMSSRLIQLSPAETDREIAIVLARIGTLLEVDRCYLFRASPALYIHHTQEWCRSGVESTAHRYENYPLNTSPWFVPQLLKQHLVALSQLDDLPPEGQEERKRFARHGIQSLAVVTLSYQGQVLGFLGCDSVQQKRDWQDKELTLMRLFGEMLSHALLHQQQRTLQTHGHLSRADAQQQRGSLVSVDELTGLPNQQVFRQQLQSAVTQTREQPKALSLLLMNVDAFKDYNASLGYMEGDHCLRRLAALLQQHFPGKQSRIARIGGDEFGVLLPGMDAATCQGMAENLRLAIWQLGIPHPRSAASPCMTVSIGITTLQPGRHHDGDELLAEAAHCLQQAKQLGGNRVCHDDAAP